MITHSQELCEGCMLHAKLLRSNCPRLGHLLDSEGTSGHPQRTVLREATTVGNRSDCHVKFSGKFQTALASSMLPTCQHGRYTSSNLYNLTINKFKLSP